jgi:uncharacterized membrane protein
VLTANVGAITGDWEMVVDSAIHQVLGMGIGVLGSWLTSRALVEFSIVASPLQVGSLELISLRASPAAAAVVIGVAAGAAAAFGLTTQGPLSLIGVMISAALVPAAATTGIGVTWGRPLLAIGSFLLLAVTMLAVNVSAFATLALVGYQTDVGGLIPDSPGASTARRWAALSLLVVLLVPLVAGALFGTYDQITTQREITREVENVLNRPAYRDVKLVGLNVEYASPVVPTGPTTVTLTLARPADTSYENLPEELQRAIGRETETNTTVRIEYVEYARPDGSANDSQARTRTRFPGSVRRPRTLRPSTDGRPAPSV